MKCGAIYITDVLIARILRTACLGIGIDGSGYALTGIGFVGVLTLVTV